MMGASILIAAVLAWLLPDVAPDSAKVEPGPWLGVLYLPTAAEPTTTQLGVCLFDVRNHSRGVADLHVTVCTDDMGTAVVSERQKILDDRSLDAIICIDDVETCALLHADTPTLPVVVAVAAITDPARLVSLAYELNLRHPVYVIGSGPVAASTIRAAMEAWESLSRPSPVKFVVLAQSTTEPFLVPVTDAGRAKGCERAFLMITALPPALTLRDILVDAELRSTLLHVLNF